MRIVVTGATGFLGNHLMPILKDSYTNSEIIGLSSKDYNLLNPVEVTQMFEQLKPEILIHLAAYSGGIGANKDFPADFFYRNIILSSLVFENAAKFNTKKLIYTMGGCSYPATAKSPIHESQMWEGYAQDESAGYSMAKKMGIVASKSYRKQYGLNSVVLIPGNMYGEFDNFRLNESHVVPAMIRKFYEAKINNLDSLTFWGTGEPLRDFVYAGDVANCLPYFIENYDFSDPVNISSGSTTSIKELALSIQKYSGFTGDILWDKTKPDGQKIKIFDVSKLNSLGLSCQTSLENGIKRTSEWFIKNYNKKGEGIRL